MGFLGSELAEQHRADLAAFLGGVAALSDPALGLRIWPVTLESGSVSTFGSVQTVQLSNASALGTSELVSTLLLQGLGALAPVAQAPDALPVGGGGCSTRPPGGRGVIDPVLWFVALAAFMALYRRRRH